MRPVSQQGRQAERPLQPMTLAALCGSWSQRTAMVSSRFGTPAWVASSLCCALATPAPPAGLSPSALLPRNVDNGSREPPAKWACKGVRIVAVSIPKPLTPAMHALQRQRCQPAKLQQCCNGGSTGSQLSNLSSAWPILCGRVRIRDQGPGQSEPTGPSPTGHIWL